MQSLIRIVFIVLVTFLFGHGAYAQLLLPETEYSIEARKVMKERLGRIGLVVHRVSEGRSRLLLSSGEGAYCTLGMVVRRMRWGDVPPVMAFRVSEPVDADLEGIGKCRLLGALFLHEDATIVGGNKMTSGVYLLAYSQNAKKVLVIEIKVEGGGRVAYRELGRVPLENPDTGRGAAEPYVGVSFPTEETLADDNPGHRVTIDLAWKRESYMFRVADVDFIML